MKLPPITLRRLYRHDDKERKGSFVIVAEPLPIDVHARMTDAEHMQRRDAEREAIAAAWAKHRSLS